MRNRVVTDTVSRGIYVPLRLRALVRRCIISTLEAEGVYGCEVAVHFSDNRFIHGLNLEHRDVDRATDVLSFPYLELKRGDKPSPQDAIGSRVLLGEMVISLERAAEQAEEYGHSIERETGFLAVHSTLHLLGYDHEAGPEEERIHFARQEEILEDMGLVRA